MTSFYAQAFANLAVYGPSYTPTKGEEMSLEEKYKALWMGFYDQKKDEGVGGQELIAALVGATGACVMGLAAEIDILRNELVAKGLLESA